MMSLPCRPFAHGWAFPQEQADTRGTRGPCLNPCQVLRISRNCQWRHCFDTDGLPWQVSNLPRCHPSTHCLISSPCGTAGNWTAAISLMDKSCLPKPPLTLTASIFVGWIIISSIIGTYFALLVPHHPIHSGVIQGPHTS